MLAQVAHVQRLPAVVSPPERGVIAICSRIPDVKPYAYWVDQCFVVPARLTQQRCCIHSIHRSQCEYTFEPTVCLCRSACT